METVLSALISGGLALIGVIVSGRSTSNKIQHQLEISQAIMNTKIDHLTIEVREHNNFAKRVPVLENKTDELRDKVIDLERYHKQPVN